MEGTESWRALQVEFSETYPSTANETRQRR